MLQGTRVYSFLFSLYLTVDFLAAKEKSETYKMIQFLLFLFKAFLKVYRNKDFLKY